MSAETVTLTLILVLLLGALAVSLWRNYRDTQEAGEDE